MEEGNKNIKQKTGRPIPVRHAKETLSPFVIRLGSLPQPLELLNERIPTDAFNFLAADEETEPELVFEIPKKNDDASPLLITPFELASQLEEDKNEIDVVLDLPESEECENDEEEQDESDAVILEDKAFIPMEKHAVAGGSGWPRAAGVFLLLAIACILPLWFLSYVGELREAKAYVASQSDGALSDIGEAANDIARQDLAEASQSFGQAVEKFEMAKETIRELGNGTSLLLSALPQTKKAYKTSERLLRAGSSLAKAGARVAEGLSSVPGATDSNLTTRISTLAQYVSSAIPLVTDAKKQFSRVDLEALPEANREVFQKIRAGIPSVEKTLVEFLEFSGMATEILGAKEEKTYLVVFQNNTELRPTGGFMGSFAELTLKDGAIVSMNIPGGGTYDVDGGIKNPIKAPKPIQLLSARWEFRDANWFPDFPTSARKIMKIYEEASGSTVDGVIAVNATFVTGLLDLMGPIDMPDYKRAINSQNFLSEAQKIVENEYDRKENKPKAFIADLAAIFLDRTSKKTGEDFFRLLDLARRGLAEREIQVYLSDNALESRARSLGWGGEIKQTDGDALMIVNTNLGGGKTDGVIKETVNVNVTIDRDGTTTNTVTITREHFGVPHALFTGANNVNHIRLYVPKGSDLLSASGFSPPPDHLFKKPNADWITDTDVAYGEENISKDAESDTDIFEEHGRTVFGNWTQTKPGTTTKTIFSYRLPWKIAPLKNVGKVSERVRTAIGIPRTGAYTLAIQKQAGAMDRTTIVELNLPDNVTLLWSSSDPEKATYTNKTDAFFSALLEYRASSHL